MSSTILQAGKRLVLCFLLVSFALVSLALAQTTKPFLHPLFTDNMVLQRNIAAPIWGWTTPGASVTVSLNGKTANTIADAQGKWMAKLGPFTAGGPYTLVVTGPQTLTIKNVMVGDVWICSGQSNMEMGIGIAGNAKEEIANANYPNIRLFSVPKVNALEPQETVNSQWQICTPETVSAGGWGGFSASGFYFGRFLYKELHIPIGLIHTSWGGTVAEAWTSGRALKTMADFKPAVEDLDKYLELQKSGNENYLRELNAWYQKNDPGSANGFADPAISTADWKTMNLPNRVESQLPNFDGIVWFRKEIDLPADWSGKDAVLHLGNVDDFDTTWVNGVLVGHNERYTILRDYKVAASVLKPGRNVIAVRVLDTGGGGGLYSDAQLMKLDIVGAAQTSSITLAGNWQYHVGPALTSLSLAPVMLTNNSSSTTVLYNGMIAPLVPYGIKGAIWYQGEANVARGKQYQTLLPTLIKDWRSRFGVGEFPFLIVQLANFMAIKDQPSDSGWAEVREAQMLTAQKLKRTGLAVAIDIGEAKDIHPKNKQEVGHRLGLAALAIAYGKKIDYSGPIYRSMKVKGNTIRVKFDHVGAGLVAKGDKLTGFAIAGVDKKFVWADAVIDGNTVIISSPQVASPVAVRYAWADNPICNLYNKAGLPASPFRTDGK